MNYTDLTPDQQARLDAFARTFADEVRARKALGDTNAVYHSQAPKNDAYKLLLEAGFSVSDAVTTFRFLVEEMNT